MRISFCLDRMMLGPRKYYKCPSKPDLQWWQTWVSYWQLASLVCPLTLDMSQECWQKQTAPLHHWQRLPPGLLAPYSATPPSGTPTDVTCLLFTGISTSRPTWPTNSTSFPSPHSATVEGFSKFPFRGKLDVYCSDLIPLGGVLPPPPPQALPFSFAWPQGSSTVAGPAS